MSPALALTIEEKDKVIERIASRYQKRWLRGYVKGKMKTDPAYQITLETAKDSNLPLLDLGCGMGFLAFYLREFGLNMPIRGIDFDPKKVRAAQEIADVHYSGAEFIVRDVAAAHDFSGNVVMLDVLQYLDMGSQRKILNQMPDLVAPGGFCLIRATPGDSSWRFRITRWVDQINGGNWMKTGPVHYQTIAEITEPFFSAGFKGEVKPLWGNTPFNSHLFLFRRD